MTSDHPGGEAAAHPDPVDPLTQPGRDPRLIAFFLTQYHPIPENDEWWGKGFTEWTNVTKAKGLFHGHYQPHLPSDLGFYDLRLPETRHEQVKLAKEYGIDGFCYYYYWFSGRRILHRPLEDMLADPEHDMPFCLCWANENWSRRWDAAEHEVLLAQRYLPEDNLEFIKSLEPYLRDSRYIRKDGKPLILVYRPQHLPDPAESARVWRQYCHEAGIGEIHLCAALTHGNTDYKAFGFDSGVEFPPHNLSGGAVTDQVSFYDDFSGYLFHYKDIADLYWNRSYDGDVYRTVFPSWDNTARRGGRSLVVLNGTPDNYEFWLSRTVDRARGDASAGDFVFINAWNEWAEGCHLEPDRVWGRSFLEATLRVKRGERRHEGFTDVGLPPQAIAADTSLISDLGRTVRIHMKRKVQSVLSRGSRRLWLRRKARALVNKFTAVSTAVKARS